MDKKNVILYVISFKILEINLRNEGIIMTHRFEEIVTHGIEGIIMTHSIEGIIMTHSIEGIIMT